ncbi:hypothetical protein [Actinomadura flavalba]|nr:hypothetical protein [Actinomadura flavalba]
MARTAAVPDEIVSALVLEPESPVADPPLAAPPPPDAPLLPPAPADA